MVEEQGKSVSGFFNHKWDIQNIPLQGRGTVKEKGAKRWQAPDNAKNQSKQCLLDREKLWHVGIHEQDQVSPHYGIEGEDAPEPPRLTKEL